MAQRRKATDLKRSKVGGSAARARITSVLGHFARWRVRAGHERLRNRAKPELACCERPSARSARLARPVASQPLPHKGRLPAAALLPPVPGPFFAIPELRWPQ